MLKNNTKSFIFNRATYSPPLERCPLCGSIEIEFKYFIERYRQPFKIDSCSQCGFIFMNPRFNDKSIAEMYGENYYSGNAEYSYHDERESLKFSRYVWDSRIKTIRKYIPRGNFLDVGCSFGGLLQCAEKHFTPYGIELSHFSATHARSLLGENVHIGNLSDHPFKKNFFSVITMIELLEHLPDPVESLRECYKLLKDNGCLVIQTANMDGLQAKYQKDNYAYYMPGHLSYFTQKNLTALLKKIGFKKTRVFLPVDFGLVPKLKKSRGSFKTFLDYKAWIRISLYHLLGKVHFKNFAATSSMVIYAFK